MGVRKQLAVVAFIVLGVLGGSRFSRADVILVEEMAFEVRNATAGPVTYQVSWGKDWKAVTLKPGQTRLHFHRLGSSKSRPTPVLRFAVKGNGQGAVRTFRPETNETGDGQDPPHYAFRVVSGQLGLSMQPPPPIGPDVIIR